MNETGIEFKRLITAEIKSYVLENKANYSVELQGPYFEEPIVQFAAADDSLFGEYKEIIGPDHATPSEVIERSFGTGSFNGGSVISVVLPISEATRRANQAQKSRSSREWALLRTFGDEYMMKGLRGHLVDYLTNLGFRAVAPLDTDWYNVQGSVCQTKVPCESRNPQRTAR